MISYSRPNSLYPRLNCLTTKPFRVAPTHVAYTLYTQSDSGRSGTEKPRGRTGGLETLELPTECREAQNYARFKTSLESCAVVAWTRSTKNQYGRPGSIYNKKFWRIYRRPIVSHPPPPPPTPHCLRKKGFFEKKEKVVLGFRWPVMDNLHSRYVRN